MRIALIAVAVLAYLYLWFHVFTRGNGRHVDRRRRARGRRRFLLMAAAGAGVLLLPELKRPERLSTSLTEPEEVTGPGRQALGIGTPMRDRGSVGKPAATPSHTPIKAIRKAPPSRPLSQRQKILAECKRWLGVKYSWGGGSLSGPTLGFGRGANTVGMDCSAYTRLVYYKALGIKLPRVAHDQMNALKVTTSPKAGDLVFFTDSSGHAYHCGVYINRTVMYAAPKTGDVIRKQLISARNIRFRTW